VTRVVAVSLLAVSVLATNAAGSSHIDTNFRFELAAASIDGHALLGKKLSKVTRALGIPKNRSLGHKRSGSVRYANGSLSVMFKLRGRALRVTAIAITSTQAREARLGRILRLPPDELQRKIENGYAHTFRLANAYACSRFGCRGQFKTADGKTKLEFGPLPGEQSYIVIQS
jgi:hypothetical protein